MTDPDPTDDDLRAFAHSLFAPHADPEPDEHDLKVASQLPPAAAARNLFTPEAGDAEPDEPDDDTRTARNLFAPKGES